MRGIWIFLVFLTVIGCQTTSDLYGSGPIELSFSAKKGYEQYLSNGTGAWAFAVSQDGRTYGYVYCKGGSACGGLVGSAYDAIGYCERNSGGVPCKLYDYRRKIVWDRMVQASKSTVLAKQSSPFPSEHFPTRVKILSPSQKQGFQEYIDAFSRSPDLTGAFYVEEKGYGYGWQTMGRGFSAEAVARAFERCMTNARLSECKIYAFDTEVLEPKP